MLLIETERAMIRQSKRLILLCDSTKFARQGNLFLCGFERIDTIITDEGIPTDQRTFLEKKEINVVVV
jgi:DeoR family ulaG and ulaABCDEF operon transcriptional repressor